MKKIFTILLISIILLSFSACLGYEIEVQDDDNNSKPTYYTNNSPANNNNTDSTPSDNIEEVESTQSDNSEEADENYGGLTLGDTFPFDGLEITIGTSIELLIFENGSGIIRIPINVKNTKNESHSLNSWNVTCFGSKGIEANQIKYFDDVIQDKSIRSNFETKMAIYCLYDGDGDYFVEFDNWLKDKTEVRIPVKKQTVEGT